MPFRVAAQAFEILRARIRIRVAGVGAVSVTAHKVTVKKCAGATVARVQMARSAFSRARICGPARSALDWGGGTPPSSGILSSHRASQGRRRPAAARKVPSARATRICAQTPQRRQQAGEGQSGSELPHSKMGPVSAFRQRSLRSRVRAGVELFFEEFQCDQSAVPSGEGAC
jgi:hypothetical protein